MSTLSLAFRDLISLLRSLEINCDTHLYLHISNRYLSPPLFLHTSKIFCKFIEGRMAISPYLAVRAIGNAGVCQPGRVVNGNNFIPLGNGFNGTVSGSGTSGDPAGLGLEVQNFDVRYGNDESRIVQWGDDIFLWQQNRIRQYNPTTEDWDIVHTVIDQEDANNWNYHTGLHFMHAADGSPLLIGLAGRQSTTGVVRVRFDGPP
jgi:hypothetical protein